MMLVDNFYRSVRANIERTGRQVLGVGGNPPFTYTIGNALAGKPELLMFGVDPRDATGILNHVSVMDLTEVKDGDPISLGGKFPLKAIRCGPRAKTEFTIQATRYLGHADYDVLQLLAPDLAGRYPGDPLCQEKFARVPVLRADA